MINATHGTKTKYNIFSIMAHDALGKASLLNMQWFKIILTKLYRDKSYVIPIKPATLGVTGDGQTQTDATIICRALSDHEEREDADTSELQRKPLVCCHDRPRKGKAYVYN
ncbi:hypothetical protein F442_15650 [Phytophthora nicotianae P10297]|uniref:Uncharacterized protein n=3 Tax=Phytophthora nicotianae TaxID=4792 RepID=W2YNL0_PHYNI|nr:hypothetical protein L915_15367 [Phytophthora nicotianae]ETL85349.1 hypothetical protein L917_15085 [Phytophthora nicotianae]ETO67242.1 hypothetical protein F444_15791 [Phytophthora nicotianae P1976]ETP36417.1 hypothetical protein F442_15650 [Phytophthora nicotianae P10297]